MSAIPCTSVNLKTMADGTLRISFDVEPNNAQDAFKLFASPGTPAVLAALNVGYAAVQPAPQPAPATSPKKTGPLCLLAVRFGDEDAFREWATEHFGYDITTAAEVAEMIRTVCNIESRKDLDTSDFASEVFHEQIRKPYVAWRNDRGLR